MSTGNVILAKKNKYTSRKNVKAILFFSSLYDYTDIERANYFAEKETWKSMKPDLIAAWTLILCFFVLVFNFVLLET